MAQEADNLSRLPEQEATLGQRLKAARLNAGWEQSQVAEHLEVHKVTVSKWERDIQTPGADFLLDLASFYGVSLEYLLRGEPVTEDVFRGTGGVAEPRTRYEGSAPAAEGRLAPNLPHPARMYLADLRVRLTRAGVDDAEIAGVEATLRAVAGAGFYPSPTDVRNGIEAVAEGALLPELRRRGHRIPGRAGGVVIGANHQVHHESEVLAPDATDAPGATEPASAAAPGAPPAGGSRRPRRRAAGE